jgi:hypothetical protein
LLGVRAEQIGRVGDQLVCAFAVRDTDAPRFAFLSGNVVTAGEAVAVAQIKSFHGVVVAAYAAGTPIKVGHQ